MKVLGFISGLALLTLQGCMSIPEINSKMRQIDVAWELESQKLEDSHRIRALNVSKGQTMEILKKVFLDLGMPLDTYSASTGKIETISVAPTPLSKAEWVEIRKIENPKMQDIAGAFFYLPENPDKYFLIVRAKVVGNDSVSVVVLVVCINSFNRVNYFLHRFIFSGTYLMVLAGQYGFIKKK